MVPEENTENTLSNKELVEAYFSQKYLLNLLNSPTYLFNDYNVNQSIFSLENTRTNTADGFDIFGFVTANSDEISEYFHERLSALLEVTEPISANPEEVAEVISQYQLGVVSDENFSDEERDTFLTMLSVYRSSLELWVYVSVESSEDLNNGRTHAPDDDDYWKIAVIDFIGGVRGGLVGGPAGAFVGLAVNSAIATVGFWNSVCVSNCGGYNRSVLVGGTTSAIRPIRSSGSNLNYYKI